MLCLDAGVQGKSVSPDLLKANAVLPKQVSCAEIAWQGGLMITAIDHIVLTSADVDKTIAFYCDVLGMELQTFSPLDGSAPRTALCFGYQKINIHDGAAPYVPHARNPVSGAVDICLLSDHPVVDWQRRFADYGIAVEHGPVVKTGSTGPLWSVYVRDPDGNLIEISNQLDTVGDG